ncbi:MAG: helix-turn-helix transcriptional regulator [Lachnospiraceae bacterium]|nr:helix-turn-helix transcriptional regulator [Lachnospiraceae bacterium]
MSAPLIPERLKKSREACGINKTEAAKIIGLTQSGYVRYENGERKPTIQVIEAMAACLNTSVDYLIGESDNPEADRIVVEKEKNPILFEISESFDNLSKTKQARLLEYYNKLVKGK